MPQYPANINLSSLTGSNGFALLGVAKYDLSGASVASAGDVNGDGFADLIVGAPGAGPHGNGSGATYLVFGTGAGFPATVDLSRLDGGNGFKLSGVATGDRSGSSVASAGDVNGDGFADLIVGAPGANGSSGASYVVFGRSAGFAANLDLSGVNGTNGFKLSGAGVANDYTGTSVASAGDVNGDGFADLIVGAGGADPHGAGSGATYVVFGKRTGFGANFALSGLNGSNGFKLSGVTTGDASGFSVASAGDVNGDGYADLIVGAQFADPDGTSSGASYVVFGKTSGFAANIDLSSLNGTNGFRLSGESTNDTSGFSVASAGDVNGDGFADLIVGAPHGAGPFGISVGRSYVVFGKAGGFAPTIDLASLNGSNGFALGTTYAGAHSERIGTSVASAGDVNGDGFADLIVGAPGANPHGAYSGASYVVFGKAAGFAASIDLSSLDGSQGFTLSGVAANDQSGASVASAGDVNGDGLSDLIVGANGAEPNGTLSGTSYVIFGREPDAAVTRSGTDAAQTLVGGAFADLLFGLGGNDKLYGHGGNDDLNGGTGADTMIGGAGNDTYYVDNAADEVIEGSGGGSDVVLASVNYALSAGQSIETLGTTDSFGTAALNLTGNDLAQRLGGNFGDNILDGKGGADTMDGRGGNDTYYVDNAGDQVLEATGRGTDRVNAGVSYALAAGQEIETLQTVSTASTTAIDLTGNEIANTLIGNSAGNMLNGGAGADTMAGGAGNDTYAVDNAGDRVSEALNAGYDTVDTTLNTYQLGANVERVNFTGSGNFASSGNDLDNRFGGGAGDDRFVTSAGADIYGGGIGTDTVDYRTATTGAVLNFATSTFGGAAAGDTFGSIEKFFGSDTAADSMTGGAAGRFVFSGFGGNDTLTGGNNIDQLSGGVGNDTLAGLGGVDLLDGGAGNDTMTGGAGADRFVYSAAGFGKDAITDFEDGLDTFKVNSVVAKAIGDFTITGNGSANVGLTLNADPNQTIAVHGAGGANLTLTAKDFVFY